MATKMKRLIQTHAQLLVAFQKSGGTPINYTDDLGNNTVIQWSGDGDKWKLSKINENTTIAKKNINNEIFSITLRVLQGSDLMNELEKKLNAELNYNGDPYFHMEVHENVSATETRRYVLAGCVVKKIPDFAHSMVESEDDMIATVEIAADSIERK